MLIKKIAALIVLCAINFAAHAEKYIIDTEPDIIGSVGEFGVRQYHANIVGQTFSLLKNTSLTGFSLFLKNGTGTVAGEAYLTSWDEGRPTAILYQSGRNFYHSSWMDSKPTEMSFSFPTATLEAEKEYAIFVRFYSSINGVGVTGLASMAMVSPSFGKSFLTGYTGYSSNGEARDSIPLSDASWIQQSGPELALRLEGATVVYEPSSPLLFLAGLGLFPLLAKSRCTA